MTTDHGYFGPGSITWEVNQELTVLFGGARALLMHAAHPLVAAGARQTSMYSRDPWARLLRTLVLQSTVTFGTTAEANEAADVINRLHRRINGTDPITGLRYDAFDHELLLWVHAVLEVSSLDFFERTVRPLTREERQRYHEESMVAAELVLLPRTAIPPTIEATEAWIHQVIASGILQRTDVAEDVADIIRSGPVPRSVKWMWGFIAFAAFGSLPQPVREIYGVRWGSVRQWWLDTSLRFLSWVRPLLPTRLRLIGPARIALRRQAGETDLRIADVTGGRR